MSLTETAPSQLEFESLRDIIIRINELDWRPDNSSADLSELCAGYDYFFIELMGRICVDDERSQIIGSFRWYISATSLTRQSNDVFFRLMHACIMKHSSTMHQDLSIGFIFVSYCTFPSQFFVAFQSILNHYLGIGTGSLQPITTMLTLLFEHMSSDIEVIATFLENLSRLDVCMTLFLKLISESVRLGIPSGISLCLLVAPWIVCLSSSSAHSHMLESVLTWLMDLTRLSRNSCNLYCTDDVVDKCTDGVKIHGCDVISTLSRPVNDVRPFLPNRISKLLVSFDYCIRRIVLTSVNGDVTAFESEAQEDSALQSTIFSLRPANHPKLSSAPPATPSSPFSFMTSSMALTPKSRLDAESADMMWNSSAVKTPFTPSLITPSPSALTFGSSSRAFSSAVSDVKKSEVIVVGDDDEEFCIGIAICKNSEGTITAIRLVTTQRLSPWLGNADGSVEVFGRCCCNNCSNCRTKLMAMNAVSRSSWCNTCEKKWSCSHQHSELLMIMGKNGLLLTDLILAFSSSSSTRQLSTGSSQAPSVYINHISRSIFRSCVRLFQICYSAFPDKTCAILRNECLVSDEAKMVAVRLFRTVTMIPTFLVPDLKYSDSKLSSSKSETLLATHFSLTTRMAEYIVSSTSSASQQSLKTVISDSMIAQQDAQRVRLESETAGEPLHTILSHDSNNLLSESLVSAISQSSLADSIADSDNGSFDMSIGSPEIYGPLIRKSQTRSAHDLETVVSDISVPSPTSGDCKRFDVSALIRPSSPCRTIPSLSQLQAAIMVGTHASKPFGSDDDSQYAATSQVVIDTSDDISLEVRNKGDKKVSNYAGAHSLLVDQLKHHRECLKEDIPDRLTMIRCMYKEFLDLRHHSVSLSRCDVSTVICLLDVIDHLHGTLDQIEKEALRQECNANMQLQSFQAKRSTSEDQLALVRIHYENLLDDCRQNYESRLNDWVQKYKKEINEMWKGKEDSRNRMAKLERRCEGLSRELDAWKQSSDDTVTEMHRLHQIEEKFTTLTRLTDLGQANSSISSFSLASPSNQLQSTAAVDPLEIDEKWRSLFHLTLDQDTADRNKEYLRIAVSINVQLQDVDLMCVKLNSIPISRLKSRRSFSGTPSNMSSTADFQPDGPAVTSGRKNHLAEMLAFLCSEVNRVMDNVNTNKIGDELALLKLVGNICKSWKQYSFICANYAHRLEGVCKTCKQENKSLKHQLDQVLVENAQQNIQTSSTVLELQERVEFLSKQLLTQANQSGEDSRQWDRYLSAKSNRMSRVDEEMDLVDEGTILTPKSILMSLKDDYYTSTPPETTRHGRSQSLKVSASPTMSAANVINPSTPQFKTSARSNEPSISTTRTTSTGSSNESFIDGAKVQGQPKITSSDYCSPS